jgi:hypothetical protein
LRSFALNIREASFDVASGGYHNDPRSGKLDFVRKYDVEIGERTMWWMGMVGL